MQHASGLAEGVAGSRMRTEAGKMPGSLIFPIRNGHGVSNDRFGVTQIGHQTSGRLPACAMQHASRLAEGVAGYVEA